MGETVGVYHLGAERRATTIANKSRSIRRESGSMREMNWPPARRAEGTLILRPRLQARALSGRGSRMVSGDVEAAVTAIAPGAPILGLYALAPRARTRCALPATALSW